MKDIRDTEQEAVVSGCNCLILLVLFGIGIFLSIVVLLAIWGGMGWGVLGWLFSHMVN